MGDSEAEFKGTHAVSWTLGAPTRAEKTQWLAAFDAARRSVGHFVTEQGLVPRGAETTTDDVNYTAAMAAIIKRPDADTALTSSEISRYVGMSPMRYHATENDVDSAWTEKHVRDEFQTLW